MSSLQCAATLVLARCAGAARGGGQAVLDGAEEESARRLGRRLAGRRVASVWSSTAPHALRTAALAAAAFGTPVTPCPGLDPVGADEGDDTAVARMRDVLQHAADLHRGETVLLVTHGPLVELAVPRLARLSVRPTPLPPTGLVELTVDDEWWCHTWEGAGAGATRDQD